MSRPELNEKISIDDFTGFYWLKEELVNFCKLHGIKATGSKIEIATQIKEFLRSGQRAVRPERRKKTSNFNWKKATLSLQTIITDNYQNTENVRTFMVAYAGKSFHFTVGFMKWLKENTGKTLADGVTEWHRQHALSKDKNYVTEIGPQFEYNRYLRAFLADNPGLTTKDAIRFWKLKKAMRGTNEYAKSDLAIGQ